MNRFPNQVESKNNSPLQQGTPTKQIGLFHKGKASLRGEYVPDVHTGVTYPQVAHFPQGKHPKWSGENSQPAQAEVTHPMTPNVDRSSRHFSSQQLHAMGGQCLSGTALPDPWSKMGSSSCWGLREGPGRGQPVMGMDS